MNRMHLVMWVALAAAIVIPVYFMRRTREVFAGFNQLVAERHLTARADSPVGAFAAKNPPLGLHSYAAYDGQLRPQVPMSLLLLKRTESVVMNGVPMQTSTIYVGAYLPPAIKLDDGWVKAWQDKAARQQGGVVYAARAAEGGVVIVWQGAPSRDNVATRLGDLGGSLPAS